MKCEHDDCFTCPYSDCIREGRKKKYSKNRKEYQRQYYLEHKKEILKKRHEAYLRRKGLIDNDKQRENQSVNR